MTNPLDVINNLVNAAASQSQVRWLMCRECGNVLQHDMSTMPPATPCPACSAAFNRVTFGSKELAEQKRRELREAKGLPLSPADLALLSPATPAPEPQAATTPPTPAPEPPVAPAPVAPAPVAEKPKRNRAPKATAPVVPSVQVEESAPVEVPEIAASLPGNPVHFVQIPESPVEDWAAKRDADKATFLAKFNLSPVAWTPVGSGRLFATGFWTTNDDGSRRVDWFEIHDTPASFAARYQEARARDPKTSADQALCNDLSADLLLVAFRGTVTASLRQILQTTSVRPTYGCRVQLSAKLTEHGNIAFQVTGVSK